MSLGSPDRPIHTGGESPAGRNGAVIAICGAVLSLLSFFVLPYVSILWFSVTGAELADLSAETRQLVYGDSGGEWLLAWWLIPLAAAAALLIAILMRTTPSQPRRVLAAVLVVIGATVTVGMLVAFSYLANEVDSDLASAATGLGFWLTVVGGVAIAVGGVVRLAGGSRVHY
jgi:hypothetical protein